MKKFLIFLLKMLTFFLHRYIFNTVTRQQAGVAQLVEQQTENLPVVGPIPIAGISCGSHITAHYLSLPS